MSDTKSATTHAFQAEVKQVLDIVAHSIYKDKDIFLRELVSNASDALEKLRYTQLTEKAVFEPERELAVEVSTDEAAGTLTIADSGIGMTREELVKENLALKKENQALRRELVRQRGGEPAIDLSRVREKKGVAGEETNGKATDDGGHWLSSEKQRRHNSKCKYYKLGRGRPCRKDEGTPCKRCGG